MGFRGPDAAASIPNTKMHPIMNICLWMPISLILGGCAGDKSEKWKNLITSPPNYTLGTSNIGGN